MVKEFQFGLSKPEKKKPRILNAKLGYQNPKIKVANWFNYQESLPYDYELEYPEIVRAAKYKTFGDTKTQCDFSTTTHDMTQQIWLKSHSYKNIIHTKPKIDYYTYSTKIDNILKIENIRVDSTDYVSVMKSDFINPKYTINYGITLPKEDPALYKPKIIMGNESCEHKFVDDGIQEKLIIVQKLKRKLYRSYNFMTGKYTDEEVKHKEQNDNTEEQNNNIEDPNDNTNNQVVHCN